MKTSQRILTDILREKVGCRLYVLDLLLDEHGVFELWKYYGDRDANKLTKRKISSSEHRDVAFNSYKKALDKKLKKKEFVQLGRGEGIVSFALGQVLNPDQPAPKKSTKAVPTKKEYRKIQL